MTLPNRLRILLKSIKLKGKSPAQVVIRVQVPLLQIGKLLLSVLKERRVLFQGSAKVRPEDVVYPTQVPVPAAHQQVQQSRTGPE